MAGRTLNRKSANKETKEPTGYMQSFGLLILGIFAMFPVYSLGVKHGMNQYIPSFQGEVLASTTQPGSSAEIPQKSDVFIPPLENHRHQQSPPHVVRHILDVPEGEAPALPSIRVEDPTEVARVSGGTKYGGDGDKAHLGGFTTYDGLGVSPAVWNHMMSKLGVHSVIDVGCGKGISTLYFLEQGAEVLCVEGSHDGVEQTLLPDPQHQIVEHDYSRGPYWPAKTYDAVWSVEFLEHVGRNFHYNYIKTFRKAALIFATHSGWGGWHHVEVHKDEWWLHKFQMYGFQYSEVLTQEIRKVALDERHTSQANLTNPENLGPDGTFWNAQHIWLNMMVFVNPAVAALPEHAHLMAEPGCYLGMSEKEGLIQKDCEETKAGGEASSKLPDSYNSIKPTKEKQQAWFAQVKARIDTASQRQ